MNNHCDDTSSSSSRPWWRTPASLIFLALLVAAVAFWATGHKAHILVTVPYLVLLACPLMHLFHHRQHRGRHKHDAGDVGRGSAGRL